MVGKILEDSFQTLALGPVCLILIAPLESLLCLFKLLGDAED